MGTKIRLSEQELELVLNSDWILKKNAILVKAKKLLETISAEMQAELSPLKTILPAEVLTISPKISKGENYQGLPYLVLDFPRFFDKENIFVIRTFFWWGNFFSITIQLSGIYKQQYSEKLLQSFSVLQKNNFSICISIDPWEHHFEKSNYAPIQNLSEIEFRKLISKSPFLKIAKRFPLQQWNEVEEELLLNFRLFIELLN